MNEDYKVFHKIHRNFNCVVGSAMMHAVEVTKQFMEA